MIKRIARGVLRLVGWRVVGEIPPHRKMVVVGAPHTSNWDFLLAMFAAPALGIRIRWLGKHTLFRRPFGWFFRMLGGIPVNRGAASGVIGQTVVTFDSTEDLVLVITPEGTRGRRDHWKSGFYRIAAGARVPVVLVGVDGDRKTVEVGPEFVPTGSVRADMDLVRSFYATHRGVRPDRVGPVRLRNED